MGKSKLDCESCWEDLEDCTCGDTEVTNSIGVTCPYCGHIHEADEGHWYSEDQETEVCGNCRKEFTWIGEPQGFIWTSSRK